MSELKKSDTKEPIAVNVSSEMKYTKNNIIKSNCYKQYKDLLSALLEDNKSYTKSEIKSIIDNYLKKKVR